MRKTIDMKELEAMDAQSRRKRDMIISGLVITFVVIANVILLTSSKHPEALRTTLCIYNGLLTILGLATQRKALWMAGSAGVVAVLLAF